MKFIYKAFTESQILAEINRLLAEKGRRVQATRVIGFSGGSAVKVETTRGGMLLAVLWSPMPNYFGVRSVLRVRNPRARYTWLINGQASVNTQELVFCPEVSPIACSRDQYRDYLIASCPYTNAAGMERWVRRGESQVCWLEEGLTLAA